MDEHLNVNRAWWNERCDIVFTSHSVLSWLPDLPSWAEAIAQFLEPRGAFYIAEIHPFAQVFYDGADAAGLQVHYPCFHAPEPQRFANEGSCALQDTSLEQSTTYEWFHSLRDVVSSLVKAGLRIVWLHEFPYACCQMFPFLVRDDEGWWQPKDSNKCVPMTFSLKAVR
ncbi:MAG: hypothetical protein PVH50_01145 [Anaerolineae bacterium]